MKATHADLDACYAALPDCGRAKDLLRRMAGGEARGAPAYVVPLHNLDCQFSGIADAFGAVYHDHPCGTVPRLENVADIPFLPLDMTLAGGRFGLCLDALGQLADQARGLLAEVKRRSRE